MGIRYHPVQLISFVQPGGHRVGNELLVNSVQSVLEDVAPQIYTRHALNALRKPVSAAAVASADFRNGADLVLDDQLFEVFRHVRVQPRVHRFAVAPRRERQVSQGRTQYQNGPTCCASGKRSLTASITPKNGVTPSASMRGV